LPPEDSIRRHTWKWIGGSLIAAAVAAWLIYHALGPRQFDWRLALSSVAHLRLPWVLAACAALYATYLGRALRWAVFLRPLKAKPSVRRLLSATVIGFTAITLLGRPGEFVRPYLIAMKEKVSVTSQMAAWILERIFDLLMALLVFGFALARVTASGITVGPKLAWVLAAGGKFVTITTIVLLVLLVSFRHFAEPARRRLTEALRFLPEPHFQRAEKLVASFVQGIESTRSDGALLEVFFYSVVEWLLIVACYWCLAASFGSLSFTIIDVLIILGFVSFGQVVQIPGIGGGMQVATILVLTELFGIKLEVAAAFALLMWMITFVAIVPVGLALVFSEGLKWHNLRQLGREASA
jgi:glycosyltransferase 2 family protein